MYHCTEKGFILQEKGAIGAFFYYFAQRIDHLHKRSEALLHITIKMYQENVKKLCMSLKPQFKRV